MFLWVYSFQMDFSDKCTSYRLFHGVILPIEGIASFFGASYISGDSEKDSIGLCRVGEKPQKVPALPLLGAQTLSTVSLYEATVAQ